MNKETATYEGIRITDSGSAATEDVLIVEEALTVYLNQEPLTVTMQTPGHERELVRGLLFTEGIFKDRGTHFPYEVLETNKLGHVTKVNITTGEAEMSAVNKRTLLSVAACGICGRTELNFVTGRLEQQVGISPTLINASFIQMKEAQKAFKSSGGSHGASTFTRQGELLSIMEDVGRHNAVDKVIGELLYTQHLSDAAYLLVSGRVSYEIIAKTFSAGIPLLAAVSAPSSLAVDFAKELGITLLGFCREGRMTRYS